MRKALSALAIVALYATLGYWGLGLVTTPTLTVGYGAVALVQTGSVIETSLPTGNGTIGASFSTPTTAGTLLVLVVGAGSTGSSTPPTGWIANTAQVGLPAAASNQVVWIYPNNPGGISGLDIAVVGAAGAATWMTQVSEWSGVAVPTSTSANSAYEAYTNVGAPWLSTTTTVTPTTNTGTVRYAGSLVIATWVHKRAVAGAVVFTSPDGFTRLADNGALARTGHMDVEYQVNPGLSGSLTVKLRSDTVFTDAVPTIVVLTPGSATSPALDQSAYVSYGSIHAMLNQVDVGLMLGGRHLLESAGPGDNSGHLLEDGSGVRLLDTYLPQLGDPVTLTNPTWPVNGTGRVVSVSSEDIFDPSVRTNYNRARITAVSNSTAPGGTPPGQLADTAVGGYHLLEDGFKRILEDGTGDHLLEDTAFVYRNLSLRKSQNQDGTTTTEGYLETFEGGFQAGQTFSLTSVNLNIAAASYTIINVTTTLIGSASNQTPVYGIAFGDAYPTLQTVAGGALTRTASIATQQVGVAMPGGILGQASVTATQGTFTAATDITGLSVTVTVGSGRRIRVKCACSGSSSIAGDLIGFYIVESGTKLQTFRPTQATAANQVVFATFDVELTPTAGSHTYNISMDRSGGTGNITMEAASSQPASITVEDLGT